MKNTIITLVIILCITNITAQKRTTRNIDELRQRVHNSNYDDTIIETLGLDLNDYIADNEITYNDDFELKSEKDILSMFSDIIKARENREIPSSVWDNLNVGDLAGGSINTDGSINIDGYIGNMPMPGGDFNLDIGNPGGGNGNSSYARRGYGKKGSGVGDLSNPTGNIGNDDFRGVPGQGHRSSGGNTWNVNATHSSTKNSNGSTTTSFYHHTSSVSSDSGYHSETDTQHYNNGDGTWVTKKTVSQTQADGSNSTCNQTTTKDEDGTVKTTTTVTKTDADGNVISENTTEKEKKDNTYDDPREEYENGVTPPGPIEIAMAVYRAVTINSLAGGNNGDTNDPRIEATQNSNGNGMINVNDGSTLGNIKPKTTGGKINVNKVQVNEQVTNPGKKD